VRRKKSNLGVVVLLMAAATGATGLVYYVRTTAQEVPADLRREAKSESGATTTKPVRQEQVQKRFVVVFLPREGGPQTSFRQVTREAPREADLRVFAINEFLTGSNVAPPDARLLSLELEERHAKLHFNAAFRTTYGSMDEGTIIEGLRRSLGQFVEVATFEMFAEGEVIDTFGHVEFDTPITVLRG
jgi:hypothetical protein